MTNNDTIKWLENLKQDIGQLRHEDLWPYAQAIDEICDLLEEKELIVRCKDCRYLNEESGICVIGIKHGYRDTWFCAYGKRR